MRQENKAKITKFLLLAQDKTKELNVPQITDMVQNEFPDMPGLTKSVVYGIVKSFEIPFNNRLEGSIQQSEILDIKRRFNRLLGILNGNLLLNSLHQTELKFDMEDSVE